MRYFLDLKNSVVVLCSLDDADPVTEVVNSSLSNFTEFIHRLGVYYETGNGEVDQLEAHLRDRDPFAFRHPNTWWSMALRAFKTSELT